MVMHSQSLEEVYPLPLILGLRHYIYHPASPFLALDFMLRVQVNGLALSQKHGLDYLGIYQFRGVII
jgi:hypothetical protein